MRSTVMSNPAVRQAFAMATNRATYVSANGGEGAGDPSWSILAPSIDPSGVEPPSGSSVMGDPEAARKVLTDAGVRLPVTVRVVHAKSALIDKAYAALAAGWERAGFDVQLTGVAAGEVLRDHRGEDVGRAATTSSAGSGPPTSRHRAGCCRRSSTRASTSTPPAPVRTSATSPTTASPPSSTRPTAPPDPAARMRVWEQVDEAIRAKGGYIALVGDEGAAPARLPGCATTRTTRWVASSTSPPSPCAEGGPTRVSRASRASGRRARRSCQAAATPRHGCSSSTPTPTTSR